MQPSRQARESLETTSASSGAQHGLDDDATALDITPAHVVGLVVGEGCFYAESKADSKYRSGWRIRPAFCIEMRHDDRHTLEAVMRVIGCGRIYELDFGRYRGYEGRGWEPHVKYRVGSLRDLYGTVVPFFRAHPLFGRKRQAFDVFAALVDLLQERRHGTPQGLAEAKELARALAGVNRRGGSRGRRSEHRVERVECTEGTG